jgi:hypothetical protein
VRKEKAAAIQEFYGSADNVSDEAQAAFLPIALSAALIGSFALLNTGTGVTAPPDSTPTFLTLLEQLKAAFQAAPYLALLPTTLVCWLFTKSELQSALARTKAGSEGGLEGVYDSETVGSDDKSDKALSVAFAGLLVLLAYLPSSPLSEIIPLQNVQWPVQNIVNMCVAITTARAVQLPRLPTVLAALAGLVAYDVVAVLGTQQVQPCLNPYLTS